MSQWRVELPSQIQPPFQVFVNGVPQEEGDDFELDGRALVFERPLTKEGKLSAWRWFLGAWGIGTYGKNDTVDVRYEVDGRTLVAHALDITPPTEAPDGPTDGAASAR